jgi:signal transduction histidine kinase
VKNVSLYEVVNEISLTLHDHLQNKEIQLLYLFDKTCTVYADEEMLKTVIRNLVGNAIKFSKHGGIIEIYIEETPLFSKIFINDNGTGIKKHFIEHIFQVESNSKKSENSIGNGHGLGLIICKDIVEKHGGTIGVESEEGKG